MNIYSDSVVAIGNPIKSDLGEIQCILDSRYGAGIFWSSYADTESGTFKNGFMVGGATYEVKDEDVESFKLHINRNK